jgi:hypothetical protein
LAPKEGFIVGNVSHSTSKKIVDYSSEEIEHKKLLIGGLNLNLIKIMQANPFQKAFIILLLVEMYVPFMNKMEILKRNGEQVSKVTAHIKSLGGLNFKRIATT